MAEPSDNSNPPASSNLSLPTGEGIIIDMGTGDGTFAYQCAQSNPRKFVIGIDANPRPLEKISEKIHRKPAKGGVPNLLFLQAAVEDLPAELNGLADEIHVHFPWGSLLGALIRGDDAVLRAIRQICAPGALLELVVGLDEERDRAEIERVGLSEINKAYIKNVLAQRYLAAGFLIRESGELPPGGWEWLHTAWAKRLKDNPKRRLTYLIAEAVE